MADLQSPSADWPLATPWARTRRQKRRGEGRLPHSKRTVSYQENPTPESYTVITGYQALPSSQNPTIYYL